MEIKYPDFVWYLYKKKRLELDPQRESFVVEPQTNQGMRILGQNTVKVTSRSILYIHIYKYTCRKIV